ncbi:iron ABC transporter permease [Chelativorans sp. AA-79]|uniref:ABC transporter permease n=1 Tax=Chelativorans sp. AA-79 TaxID=3028735 RepID=UPI0023F63CA7|nr:iron ABC transporter permease [Chelativorans sp. AA-79]WEX11173.1 iron ABC transporter permease [Chelativorans sp. AA-79]
MTLVSSSSSQRDTSFAGAGAHVAWFRRLQPSGLLWIVLAAILAVLIVAPVGMLVMKSFTHPDSGGFTIQNYIDAYGKARHVQALVNTLYMGAAVVVLSLLFAVPLAWACTRTNMPGRNLIRFGIFGAFVMPPYLGGVGWILLAGPNSGWLNVAWQWLTGGTESIVNIFSFPGLVLVMAINTYFTIFILVSAAFEMINSEMEDAANILGAGPFTTAMKVTLPLVLPSILGSALLTFLISIALYGVPALISIPARFPVVVIQLSEFFSFPLRIEVAAAYSIPLLLITAGLLTLQKKVLSRKGYTAVSGKGGERRIVNLGKWRWAAFAYSLFVVMLSVIMPLLVLVMAAFSKSWVGGLSLDNLTLQNFHYVLFEHSSSQKALVTSLATGAAAATAAILLALAIAYIVQRRLLPMSEVLAFLSMSPFVIPGIVLAIGFYAVYALPPVGLYGTYLILILAFTTRFLPVAYTTSMAGVRAIHPEMEEAVRILGGGRLVAVRKVVGPLLKRTLASGWLLIFVPAAQELSTAVFLVGPNTRVVSVVLLDMSEEGLLERLSALGSVLLVIIVAVMAIGVRFLGRDFMLRRS